MMCRELDIRRAYRYNAEPIGVTATMMQLMRIPHGYWHVNEEGMDFEEDQDAMRAFRTYWSHMKDALDNGYGLVINGEYGSGKTSAAILCLKHMKRWGGSGYYTTTQDYLRDVFTGTMYNESVSVHDRARQVDMLVIDDIGKEAVNLHSDRDASAIIVTSVLRDRCANQKSTILTTNLSGEQLCEVYGQYFMESLTEKMIGVTLSHVKRNRQHVTAFFAQEP